MAFNPYDLYNQDPRNQVFGAGSVPYQTQSQVFDDSEQRQRLADLLRQGVQQPANYGGQQNFDLGSLDKMKAIGKGFDKLNGANAASDYIGEFGKFDPQLQATLGNDATWMQKIGGFF